MLLRTLLFVLSFSTASYSQIQKPVGFLKGEVEAENGTKLQDVRVAGYNGTEKVSTSNFKSDPDGKFSMVLTPGNTYRITLSHDKYYFKEDQIVVPLGKGRIDVAFKARLAEIKTNQPFTFKQPIFLPKSADLNQEVLSEMENISAVLKANPKLSLAVTVYPDATIKSKKESEQQRLAASRANTITSYFMARSIPSKSIVVAQSSAAQAGKFPMTVTDTKKKKATTKTVLVPAGAELILRTGS